MNKRIIKKKVKKKYSLKTIPRGLDVKWVDWYLTGLRNKFLKLIEEKLDEAFLHGIGDNNEEDDNQRRGLENCM